MRKKIILGTWDKLSFSHFWFTMVEAWYWYNVIIQGPLPVNISILSRDISNTDIKYLKSINIYCAYVLSSLSVSSELSEWVSLSQAAEAGAAPHSQRARQRGDASWGTFYKMLRGLTYIDWHSLISVKDYKSLKSWPGWGGAPLLPPALSPGLWRGWSPPGGPGHASGGERGRPAMYDVSVMIFL